MHKKLTSELTSLAHDILTFKKRDDVFALKQKAYEVYEKLAVLAYIEEYVNNTPQAKETKEELIEQFEESLERKEVVKKEVTVIETEKNEEVTVKPEIKAKKEEGIVEEELKTTDYESAVGKTDNDFIEENNIDTEPIIEIPSDEKFEKSLEDKNKEEIVEEEPKVADYKDAIDETDNDFLEEDIYTKPNTDITFDKEFEEETVEEITEKEPIEQPFDELQQLLFDNPVIKDEASFIEELKAPQHTLEDELQDTLSVDVTANLFEKAPTRSLNDRLQNTIQIDLNDRIAFVKHLFDGNQSDFNRVISQLNTIKTEREAKSFIKKMVKPDYDWSNKEEYENRLIEIIERKFA